MVPGDPLQLGQCRTSCLLLYVNAQSVLLDPLFASPVNSSQWPARLVECVDKPSLFQFLDVNWGLSGPITQLVVREDFCPLDIEDVSEKSVGICKKLVCVGLGYPWINIFLG